MKYSLDKEKISQSEFSPGPVNDTELVGRVAYAPEDVYKGKLIPEAIKSIDLKERGFSLFRQNYCTEEDIVKLAKMQMQNRSDTRQNAFVSFFLVSLVRDCKVQITNPDNQSYNVRSFVVIDEALPELKSHAAIYAGQKFGRGTIKKIKNQLIDIINDFVQIDTYEQ